MKNPNIPALQQMMDQELYPKTKLLIQERHPFEEAIKLIYQSNQSLQVEKQAWLQYITFEINKQEFSRARLLYERALLSLDSDLQFWLLYINFIQRSLRDVTLARAKFENRKATVGAYNTGDLVELTIENAMFEEEQSNIQKARNLLENLVSEVAPGHIKSILAFIAFERRQNNNEKVKDLFYKAY